MKTTKNWIRKVLMVPVAIALALGSSMVPTTDSYAISRADYCTSSYELWTFSSTGDTCWYGTGGQSVTLYRVNRVYTGNYYAYWFSSWGAFDRPPWSDSYFSAQNAADLPQINYISRYS